MISLSTYCSVRIIYCPFFPLHDSLRIISCTDLCSVGVVWFWKEMVTRKCKNKLWEIVKISLNSWIFFTTTTTSVWCCVAVLCVVDVHCSCSNICHDVSKSQSECCWSGRRWVTNAINCTCSPFNSAIIVVIIIISHCSVCAAKHLYCGLITKTSYVFL